MNKKLIVSITLATIGLVLIVVVGLFYYKERKINIAQIEKSEVVIEEQLIQPTTKKSPIIDQKSELIADWKVYTNDKYGYSAKYPENWYVREDNSNTPGVPTKHTIQHTDFSPISNYDDYKSNAFFYSVMVWDNPSRLSVHDWLRNENPDHPALLSEQIVTVDGKEAIKYEPSGNAYFIQIWLADNDKIYQLFYCEPSKRQEYIAIFNQMLSAFRLIKK